MRWEAEPLDLRLLTQEIAGVLSVKAEAKNLALRVEIDSRLPQVVLGDRFKLGQILTNLASNALKFTAQGAVSIDVRMRSLIENIATVELSVSGHRDRIPQDKLATIFDEYKQASTTTVASTAAPASGCRSRAGSQRSTAVPSRSRARSGRARASGPCSECRSRPANYSTQDSRRPGRPSPRAACRCSRRCQPARACRRQAVIEERRLTAGNQNGWLRRELPQAGVLRLAGAASSGGSTWPQLCWHSTKKWPSATSPFSRVARRDREVHADADAAEDVLVAVHAGGPSPPHSTTPGACAAASVHGLMIVVADAARQRHERREYSLRACAS